MSKKVITTIIGGTLIIVLPIIVAFSMGNDFEDSGEQKENINSVANIDEASYSEANIKKTESQTDEDANNIESQTEVEDKIHNQNTTTLVAVDYADSNTLKDSLDFQELTEQTQVDINSNNQLNNQIEDSTTINNDDKNPSSSADSSQEEDTVKESIPDNDVADKIEKPNENIGEMNLTENNTNTNFGQLYDGK